MLASFPPKNKHVLTHKDRFNPQKNMFFLIFWTNDQSPPNPSTPTTRVPLSVPSSFESRGLCEGNLTELLHHFRGLSSRSTRSPAVAWGGALRSFAVFFFFFRGSFLGSRKRNLFPSFFFWGFSLWPQGLSFVRRKKVCQLWGNWDGKGMLDMKARTKVVKI